MIVSNIDEGVGHITLNRPLKRNALHPEMISAVVELLDSWKFDDRIKVVLLKGAGEAFCAGADLEHLLRTASGTFFENLKDAQELDSFFTRLSEFPKPVFAFVHGPALAGGCGIAMACDIVLADDSAAFGFPEAKVGFIPAMVSRFTVRALGHARALRLLFGGVTVDAEEALLIGLVQKIVGNSDEASEIAKQCAAADREVLASIKSMTADLSAMSPVAQRDYLFALNIGGRYSPAFSKGIQSFLQRKR